MATSFFLDVTAPDFNDKMTVMYKSLDGQDPLLCALVGAAHVDKCLIDVLKAVLVNSKQTKLKHFEEDKSGAMLGGLWARAEFAYLLGLFGSSMLENITGIVRVRNLFAHSHMPLTFQSPEIVAICSKFVDDALIANIDVLPMSDEAREYFQFLKHDMQRKFVTAVTRAVSTLAMIPPRLRQPLSPFKDIQ